jgi:hypothetical protein
LKGGAKNCPGRWKNIRILGVVFPSLQQRVIVPSQIGSKKERGGGEGHITSRVFAFSLYINLGK